MVIIKHRQIILSVIVSFVGMMLFFGAVFLSFPVNPVFAQDAVDFSQEDFNDLGDNTPYFEDLVLAVVAEQQVLSSGMFAVQYNGRYYLPIGQLSEILDFHVEIDRDRRSVGGWALSKDNEFFLDASTGVIEYNGKVAQLPAEAILDASIQGDDIYVLRELFDQIWPLELEIDLSSLILNIIPDAQLPFQRVLARKKKQQSFASLAERKEREKVEGLPFVAQPYGLFGKPAADIAVSSGYDARANRTDSRLTVNGIQDLAYASADYSMAYGLLGGELDKPENIRLRFRRQNIHEGALPFGLEDVQWGDVNLSNRDLISSGLNGRGVLFTNKENAYLNEFDVITVDGTGVPGWEVELYLNGQLLDFSAVDETGIYRFEDVSIGYGNNRINVVLYGPQGQIREQTENYFYQSNMAKPGKTIVSGGIVDSQRNLIEIDPQDQFAPEGMAANTYVAHGLFNNLTVFGSANTLRDNEGGDDVRRKYVSAGIVGSFDTTVAQVEGYKEIGGGAAVDVRTLSDFKGFKVNTRTSLYNKFESPNIRETSSPRKLDFDFNVRKVFKTLLGSLGLEAGMEYKKQEDGENRTSYTSRQTLGVSGVNLTNNTRTSLVNGDHNNTSGTFSSSTRFNDWRLRNSFNYRLFPDVVASSLQSELRYGRSNKYSTAFSLGRNFESKETIAGVQISRDFKKFLGSVEANWSSAYGTSMMLRASAGLGPYGLNDEYILQSESLRNAGPVSSFVYTDKDYDGTFSDGDVPERGTKMIIGRRVTKDETDESGYLYEINSRTNGLTNIMVDQSSIDDPYLMVAIPGYSIHPRPGAVHKLQFPLIETGAIDGTLSWAHNGKPIAGLMLQLMKSDAEIVQSSKTASDGYFTFERIPPGSYTIRADPATGLNIPFQYVELTPDDLFQFGMDMSAVDLSQPMDSDLGVAVGEDGLLSAEGILSIAKGFKSKKSQSIKKSKKKTAPVETKSKPGDDADKVSMVAPSSGPTNIEAVRLGQHPDKVRVVLDLSGPLDYSLNYDPSSNSIFVDMPYANWNATESWEGKSTDLLNNYRVERVKTGLRFILGLDDGADVGASGLLKADSGKKDRLYIDVKMK